MYAFVYTAGFVSAISIKLPDDLLSESTHVAEEMGLSRSELIRQALIHEIAHFKAAKERQAMADSFRAMTKDADYLAQCDELDTGLNGVLPSESEQWWSR